MTTTDKKYLEYTLIIIAIVAFIVYRQYNPLPANPTYEPCSYQSTGIWLSESDYNQCFDNAIADAYDSIDVGTNG